MIKNKAIVKIVQRDTKYVIVESAIWCSSPLCRLIGLQFSKPLEPDHGLLLANRNESVAGSSIHMFFVFYPIAAIWINNHGLITSAQLAKPWRPYYASPEPARYILEAPPETMSRVSVGDEIDFLPA